MKRFFRSAGLLLVATALPFVGAGLYDLTAPARVPAATPAPAAAPRPLVRPALLLTPSPTSSAPHVYAA
ncbi:hypothetical protein LJ737_05345 [Hymenobacter sp. 15J16-1T3B]|uniref:hypothetical protein n=1 Tax=Hymenobacter sp. 15J16-1T3B TaxID=2886941 RepID=UPI001D11B5B1|nr:hypothetical protein [Hymenobacter sp. 15J16-1T3B]MCC3156652.1 hypothetical protein [Hymenobacter sp. 15J16-1T3B]